MVEIWVLILIVFCVLALNAFVAIYVMKVFESIKKSNEEKIAELRRTIITNETRIQILEERYNIEPITMKVIDKYVDDLVSLSIDDRSEDTKISLHARNEYEITPGCITYIKTGVICDNMNPFNCVLILTSEMAKYDLTLSSIYPYKDKNTNEIVIGIVSYYKENLGVTKDNVLYAMSANCTITKGEKVADLYISNGYSVDIIHYNNGGEQ